MNRRARAVRPRREPRMGAILTVLALASINTPFVQTILIPIQGRLPELLDAPRDATAWVITITLLVSAVCVPIAGKLGDMYGKRKIVLALLTIFIVGSAIAAVSSSVEGIIVGRGMQGAAMGVIPLSIAILRDVLPTHRLGTAVALVSATLGIGGAIALPVSAFITQYWDWHVLFLVCAALGAAAFGLVLWVVPSSTRRSGGRLDILGAVGLAAGLVAMLVAISRGNDWGWLSPSTLSLLIGGAVIFVVWGWFELRRTNPLVDLRVNSRGTVLVTNMATIAMGFALFASSIVFPQMLELPVESNGMGISLLQASLVLTPSGLAMLAMSPVVGLIERRSGPKPLLVAGSIIIALSYLASILVDLETWHILVINLTIGMGIGLGFAAMPALVMSAVPLSETGAANGLNTLMRVLGYAIAAAAIAAVLAANSNDVNGVPVPAGEGFKISLQLGLIASIVSSVLACFIPRPKRLGSAHLPLL